MYPNKIEFEHPHAWCELSKHVINPMKCEGDECTSPYVHLEDYTLQDKLKDPDEIVAPNEFILYIDYPLKKPINKFIIKEKPVTRLELAEIICELYKKIYKEEEESIKNQPIIPIERRSGLINRNATDGIHGIWGHDLSDLDLVYVKLRDYHKTGLPIYELWTDS